MPTSVAGVPLIRQRVPRDGVLLDRTGGSNRSWVNGPVLGLAGWARTSTAPIAYYQSYLWVQAANAGP